MGDPLRRRKVAGESPRSVIVVAADSDPRPSAISCMSVRQRTFAPRCSGIIGDSWMLSYYRAGRIAFWRARDFESSFGGRGWRRLLGSEAAGACVGLRDLREGRFSMTAATEIYGLTADEVVQRLSVWNVGPRAKPVDVVAVRPSLDHRAAAGRWHDLKERSSDGGRP